ncbi:MmgE/PrpD family protein [Telmatospirillum sp.]|uniref:MmgE/PrpD family protein n=1 Tax=Telmatospirillum sp. TaxID=2079197 RepID=UPI00283C5311|nr:MmgE/PrpD family protein [Telmatospirillum sp.]MDR3439718.1 MmgE/PrpD family protein [Telmatospirillum sp.]
MMPVHKQTLSERIADFSFGLALSDVPAEVREHAKLMMVDAFGVAIASYRLPHALAVRASVREQRCAPVSSLWGTSQKSSVAGAVLANAALIHGMDYDDTHVAGVVHPSASVVAAAFTVGEATGASGDEILAAVIVGYEIIIRLALAAHGGFHDRGFHCSGIVAPFAAACVGARLMGLPKPVLVNALGICGSQAAALQEFLHDGSSVKKIHPGWGCHAALYALSMAREGLTGPREVFEGGYGLYNSHIASTAHIEEAFSDLGAQWRTREITIKRYPCCHMIHSFSDCVFALQRERAFSPEEVASIECRIEGRCYRIVCSPETAKKRPTTEYGMMFSLPYVVAASILKGRITLAEMTTRQLQDPALQNLIAKVTCIEDEGRRNPGYFPGWIKITLKDGAVLQKTQDHETGTPQNPITAREIIEKYEGNTSINIDPGRGKALLDTLLHLEKLSDMGALLSLMLIDG